MASALRNACTSTVLLDVNSSASADVLAAWETKDYSKLSSILAKDDEGGWFGRLPCDRGGGAKA